MRAFESWILTYLLNSLWQVPLLFAAGWIAARGLRAVSAAAEHRVWVAVLLLESVLPACPALPWERLRALLAWAGGAFRPDDAHVSVTMGAGAGFNGLRLPAWLLAAVAMAYGATVAYFAARFVWRCERLRIIRREARELALTADAARYWAQCRGRFGVEGAAIAESSQIFSPLTMGFRRKLLLLPAAMASGLCEGDLYTVIAHECAHMRRNDFFKNLIYEIVSLPASYHPLLRLTRERILETREIVCDQMAAELDGRSQYARSLLRLASLLVNGTPARVPHTIGILDANTFERRVMRLTEKPMEMGRARRMAIVAFCAAFGVATCCSALALRMNLDAANAGTKTPALVHVSPRVMAGQVLSKVMPIYPPAAKKAGIQGTVTLKATISKQGTVEDIRAVSGPKELQKPSLDAVRRWTWKPYLLNGKPVEVETKINVVYSLEKRKK
ncbi:MAG: TonB family protein [Terracidiphilus sp.]